MRSNAAGPPPRPVRPGGEVPIRLLKRALLLLVLAWVAVVTLLFVFQRSLLYPVPPPAELPVDTLWVKAGDLRVPMLERGPGRSPDAPSATWFHGNAAQIATSVWVADALADRGISLVLAEYPGYGGAPGSPDEAGFLAAARATLGALPTKGACIGQSLGTGVAAAMAAEGRCTALVLVSPYTSLANVATFHYPFVPGFLVRDRLDTLARASSIAVPTLVLHGRSDDVVPLAMGRAVAAAIPGAHFVERDGGHNDLLDAAAFDTIADFVRGQ